jgi:hypothetical protein
MKVVVPSEKEEQKGRKNETHHHTFPSSSTQLSQNCVQNGRFDEKAQKIGDRHNGGPLELRERDKHDFWST